MTRKYYPPIKRFKIFFVVSNELYSEIFVIHLQEKLVVVTNKKCLDIIFMVTPIVHGQDGPIKLFTNNGYLLYTHRYNSVFSSVTWCNERTFLCFTFTSVSTIIFLKLNLLVLSFKLLGLSLIISKYLKHATKYPVRKKSKELDTAVEFGTISRLMIELTEKVIFVTRS